MERMFFSSRQRLAQKIPPPQFVDLFPIDSQVAGTGIFVTKGFDSVGMMIEVVAQKAAIKNLPKLVSKWLKTSYSDYSRESLSLALYVKKTSLNAPPSLIICASIPVDRRRDIKSLKQLLLTILTPKAKARAAVDASAAALGFIVGELSAAISSNQLKATPVKDDKRALSLARYFWTSESDVLRPKGHESVLEFFSRNFSVLAERRYWKENDSIRTLFNLRDIESIREVADLCSAELIKKLPPGTLVIGFTVTQPHYYTTPESFDATSSVMFFSTEPWDSEANQNYGTLRQALFFDQKLRQVYQKLLLSTGHLGWTAHDMTWNEALYASVPASLRLDKGLGAMFLDLIFSDIKIN